VQNHCIKTRILRCTPRTFACPDCGRLGYRKSCHSRNVIDFCQGQLQHITLHYAEYRSRCACCQTFRSAVRYDVLPVQPKALYSDRIRELLLGRLIEDRISGQQALASLQRDFGLKLSDGFLYDCLDWKVRQLNLKEYRAFTLQRFSGTLALDELHLGQRILLLATDPLNDLILSFAVVRDNDQEHMRGFLKNLKNHGFEPKLITSDGSHLYPKVIADLWPDARHQLCVFHLLKDLNIALLDGLRRLRLKAYPKRKSFRGRGRVPKRQIRKMKQYQEQNQRSAFLWKHRFLLVTKEANYTDEEKQTWKTMLKYLPGLKSLRTLALQTMGLFEEKLEPSEVNKRYQSWLNSLSNLKDEKLAKKLGTLNEQKFAKAMEYRCWCHQTQIRTNNHVERMNRKIRFWEKVRYRWRRRRTIIRFILLAIGVWYEKQKLDMQKPKKRLKRRKKLVSQLE
jgi:hypothetical protein